MKDIQPPVSDTDEKSAKLVRTLASQQSMASRFAAVSQLSAAARSFVLGDIRRRYPAASEEEILRQYAARTLGREEAERMYGKLSD